MKVIEDWYCTKGYEKMDFSLPDENEIKIGGIILGCSQVKDGSHIKTPIVSLATLEKVITIDSEEWKLGKMNVLYKEMLKNCEFCYENHPLEILMKKAA